MSLFTEPKAGVPFTNEQLFPVHVNRIIDSERAIFHALIASWREYTIPAGILGGVSTDPLLCWSNRESCWYFKSGSLLGAITASGRVIQTGDYSGLTSAYSTLTANQAPSGVSAIEAYPNAASTNVLVSTDAGNAWNTLIFSASLTGYTPYGAKGKWLGGGSAVQLIPATDNATHTTLAMLVRMGTSGVVLASLPDGAGSAGTMSHLQISHNGAGGAVMPYADRVWSCNFYGISSGFWSVNDLPVGTYASPFHAIDYDSETSTYVLLQRQWGTAAATPIQFATSSDGTNWQAWRTLPFSYGRAIYGDTPIIRCVGGVWFVLNAEALLPSDIANDTFQFVLWFSCDHGASWMRAGQMGATKMLASGDGGTTLFAEMEKTSDGRLVILVYEGSGSVGTATSVVLGPFTTPAALASTL